MPYNGKSEKTFEYVQIMRENSEVPYIYPHIHNHYEIYYNISGAKGYMVNGVFYKCSKRDLIVIPKLSAHKVVIDKDYSRYDRLVVNIDDNLVSVLETMGESTDWLAGNGENPPLKTTLTEGQHNMFMMLMDQYFECRGLAALAEILTFLKECFIKSEKPEFMDENAISHTDRIMMIIERNFKDITVSQVADAAHSNSDYLNRIFKSKMGITVKRYLVIRKLADAQKHLCSGKSVKEACYLSGFNDYSNFIRTFKKHFGYTPGEFEEKQKEILV